MEKYAVLQVNVLCDTKSNKISKTLKSYWFQGNGFFMNYGKKILQKAQSDAKIY